MSSTIVITDCDHGFYDPEVAVARERGVELRMADGDLSSARSADPDAILCQYVRVDGPLLDALPRCRVVGRYGVGLDNIDLDAAAERAVEVVNVPDFCVDEVADHALALALAGTRRVAQLDREWRADPEGYARGWSDRFDTLATVERSSQQRFGILGFGRTGQALAQRAAACGFEVVAHDPLVAVPTAHAAPVERDELLATSDVVSLHLPLTPETHGTIDERALALMKPGVTIVNTARGALIDERALVDGLRAGRPGHAALDVFRDEPLPADHPLFSLSNVTLTPHIAFFSRTSIRDLKHRAMALVVDALERSG